MRDPSDDGAPLPHAATFDDEGARFELDLRVYGIAAVQKTAYRLARRCTARLGLVSDDVLPVALTFARGTSRDEVREVTDMFFRELLDQQLREEVRAETAPMRSLLLALAFSRTGLATRG